MRTADDSIVDALTGIPRVDRAASQQECSVAALRMEQFRHGNPSYNPAEWTWVWGKECEGHLQSLYYNPIRAADMAMIPGGLCGLPDDPSFYTSDNLMCWDWRFYDCVKSDIPCVDPVEGIGCSYSEIEKQALLLDCPWTCGLCGTFGEEYVPAGEFTSNAGVYINPSGAGSILSDRDCL